MSTYYRLLREAAGVSATPETPLPRSELIRAVSRLHAEMMDLAHKFWHYVENADELPEDWRE